MTSHSLWQYAHILLFVYWLGADLGVFLASHYVARRDLALDERLRFLELLLKIDLGPRTALVLMIPVGFTLASDLGIAPFVAGWLVPIWIGSLVWLAGSWFLVLRARTPLANRLQVYDRALRIAVAATFIGLGLLTLTTGGPLGAPWLAAKFIAFGSVVVIGVLLRGVIRNWITGFGELRNPALVDQGNARIEAAYISAVRMAMLLWLGVAVAAFFGVVKPALQ